MPEAPTPDRIIYAEPAIWTYRSWTPGLLRSAEVSADGGNMLLAADLCEQMFADDRLRATLDTRNDALLSLPLSFDEGLGPARSRRKAVKALEVEDDFFAAFDEVDVKLLLAWGIVLGVGLAEIVWTKSPTSDRIIPKLVVRHPRHLRWDHPRQTWMLTVDNPRREIPISAGDGKWIIYTPYGSSRPWSHGAYRALSRWFLLKLYSIEDWGFYSNKSGNVTYVVTGAEGNAAQRREIAADLQQLGRNAAMALPKGFEMKLLEAQARTWETFKAQIECADNGTAVTLLGQNLTTEVSSGSQAAATVHKGVALTKTKFDAVSWPSCVHDQALTWWAEFNFGNRGLAPWPVYDTSGPEDLKAKATTLQLVSQSIATLVQAGAPVDVKALLDEYEIPTTDEPVEAPPAPPTDTSQTPNE